MCAALQRVPSHDNPADTLGEQPSYIRTGREAKPADLTVEERVRRHTSPTYLALGPAPASVLCLCSACGGRLPPVVQLWCVWTPRSSCSGALASLVLGALLLAFASVTVR